MTPKQIAENGAASRILIVDDNSDAGQTTAMLLELRGHQVETLTDSTKCLSQLEAFQPDVLLLDIGMPTVSGYDLAKEIRSQPRFEGLAIIALSGFADAEHTRRSFEFGCDEHLVKPVDLITLEKVIVEKSKNRIQLLAEGA